MSVKRNVRLVASHSQVGKALLLTLLLRKDVSFILVILGIIGIVMRIQLHVVLTCTNVSKKLAATTCCATSAAFVRRGAGKRRVLEDEGPSA